MLLHYLSALINTSEPMRVLDAGGGTGVMSLEFAKANHLVTLVDGSDEVLAIAKKRLVDTDNAQILNSDIMSLQSIGYYDLVLCHAVLEWVQSPYTIIDKLFEQVAIGGRLSLSFFNKDAALFNNAIWGNFDYIDAGLNTRNQVKLNPHNAQRPSEIIGYINDRFPGYEIEHKAGIRVFHDYLHDRRKQIDEYEKLLELELKYAATEPYMWLGKYFHLIIKKTQ